MAASSVGADVAHGRELDHEPGAAGRMGLHPEPTAVEPDVLGGEREPEPGASGGALLGAAVSTMEALEDRLALVLGHAGPGVVDGDADGGRLLGDGR